MGRLPLLVLCCVASLLLGTAPASADNGPHVEGAGLVADSCAGCHRAHTGKTGKLLTQSSQTALCYTCHGTSGTGANTDVEDGVGYSGAGRTGTAGGLRGGGFQYALIDSANPSGQGFGNAHAIPVRTSGQAVTSTHSVDSSSQLAWGNGAISATADYGTSIPLRCGSCHDPHGNGNYRILKPVPSGSGASPGVTIADASTKVYTTGSYWTTKDPNAPDYQGNISSWCTTCHTRYFTSSSADSGDAVFTHGHRSDSTVHTSNTNCAQCHDVHSQTATDSYLNCSTCHVAHGSNASMSGAYSANVAWPDGTPADSDSRLLRIDNRGVCQMCHNK